MSVSIYKEMKIVKANLLRNNICFAGSRRDEVFVLNLSDFNSISACLWQVQLSRTR